MTKEKLFSFIKKTFTIVFKGVIIGISIALILVFACVYISVLSKAVDIAYYDDGKFADLVDEIADIFTDDNYSSGTKNIVANAQVIADVDYPAIDINDLVLVNSYSGVRGGKFVSSNGITYDSYSLGYPGVFNPVPFSAYYVVLEDESYYLTGIFVASDNYTIYGDDYFISAFSLHDNYLSRKFISSFVVYNSQDEEYFLLIDDDIGDISSDVSTDIKIYSFPSSDTSNSSIDDIGSIIASGMTFGLDGITSSVSTAFDSVFLDSDGNLSNYSIFVFWALGVSVALGFFKYILDWILSLGSRK